MGEARRIAERYELVSELGAGGMGVVWRARDHRLGRDVALKLLAPGAVGNDIARARLVREARAAAGLQHEGIVHVYDVGETDDGGAFLVMELVGGRSLRILLEEGSLSFAAKAELVIGIAEALGYAHEQGIIHRDVKPDNVLVRKNGRPVVLDFGLAKPVPVGLADTIAETESKATLTKDGHIVGTPAYLAPEQIRGGTVGPFADQFALAVTAYEVFTGRLPWKGDNVLEVLASMLADQPRRADGDSADVNAAAADVLDRAMKKEPDERWSSVTAFGEALADACGIVPRSTRSTSTPPDSKLPLASARTPSKPTSKSSAKSTAKSIVATTDSAVHVPTPIAAEPVTTRPWSSRLLRAAVVAVLGTGAALGVRASMNPAKNVAPDGGSIATPTPLGADAVVACPLFDVVRDDIPKPTGWLGAAAAALACEHAQVYLGGLPERTVAPAELVSGIPREPADNAPLEPFSVESATEESRKNAATRGTATIEGTVGREGNDVTVSLTVKTKDGRELARGTGKAYELFVAVSQAMRAARSAFAALAPSAFQKEWLRVRSVDAAEDYHDVTVAVLSEDNVEIATACDRFGARTDVERDMLYFVRSVCAERLKRTAIDEGPPPIDESSPGALVTSTAAHRARGGPSATKARLEKVVALAERITKPEERAIVNGAIGELAYLASDLTRAGSHSRMAIQSSPKLVDLRGTPWHRLAFASEFDRSIAGPHAAWLAWEPVAVQNAGSHGVGVTERVNVWGRAYELGRRGFFATAYGDGLARIGNVEKARGIAEALNSDYLRVRVLMAQALFRRAIEYGLEVLRKLPDDNANAGNAYRILASLTEASRFMGKKAPFSEEILAKYLFADPPRLKIGVVPFTSLVYACTDAAPATAKKCVKRLREAYAKGEAGAVVGAAPTLLEGAQYWVDGDAKAAANAWRPLLRESGAFLDEAFRVVIMEAFDRAGMPEFSDRIDADYLSLADHPHAIDLSLARAAMRAEKRGDVVQARKLAHHMIEALRFTDSEIPLTKDLQALLDRLPPK
jgi:serine/threonine protein kinase